VSVFGSRLSGATQPASSLPLPVLMSGVTATVDGVAAALSYVSPGQVNLQIPYEVAPSPAATLSINNNGEVVSRQIAIFAAAPGIFTDASGALAPQASARARDSISLYITGGGAVSPALATGATPSSQTAVASLPRPVQTVTVTVGGARADTQFVGITPGLVGVVQINFQVPPATAPGTQAVVVTVYGIASEPALLNVTN